jgi:hypothetical protein
MGTISTTFTANTRPFQQGLKSIKSDVGDIKNMIAGVAAGFTVGAIAAFAKHIAEMGDELMAVSDATGIASDKLQALGAMGEIGGTLKMEQLPKVFMSLGKFVEAAMDPTGKEAALLARLGTSAEELQRLKPDEQFDRLNRSISALGSA